MDDIALARVVHVLALVHWLGGVAMVTTVLLPIMPRAESPSRRQALFEAFEGRFSRQVRWSVLLVGLTGAYMTQRLDAWERFLDPAYWWMHAMACVWLVFAVVLFVAEPLFLHRWFHARARTESESTFTILRRVHWLLLLVSSLTVAAGILGAHGAL